MTNKWQEKLKKFQEARKEKSAWYEKIGREILEKYQITACHKCDCRGWGRETKHSRAHAHTKKRIVCLNAEPKGYRSFFILLHEVGHIVAEKADYSSGVPNRGAKPDTQTAVGSLGWIRKTTMWASLVEVCFLTNPEDMKILHG